MKINVTHGIDDLYDDLRTITRRAPKDMIDTVKEGIRTGNTVAKDFAEESAGEHGKLYHRAFSAEMHGIVSFGGVNGYSGEYGPDSAMPQGGMSFEGGSRNQEPHNDLAKSADLIGPSFAQEVRGLPDQWFWPR